MNKRVCKKDDRSVKVDQRPIPLTTLNVTQVVDVKGFLSQAVDTYGAKRVLKALGYMCMHDSIPHTVFPMSLLADKKDEETIQVGVVVKYALDNWASMSKRALKHWKLCLKDAAKFDAGAQRSSSSSYRPSPASLHE
jgi:hypothetical protein